MHTKHLPFPNRQLHTNRTRLTCTLVCFRRYRSSFKVKESNEIVRPTWFFYVLISSQKKMCLEVKASKLLCVPTPALEPRASTGLASGSSPATWSTMEKSPERKKTKQPYECCCKNMLWNAFTLILYICIVLKCFASQWFSKLRGSLAPHLVRNTMSVILSCLPAWITTLWYHSAIVNYII